MNAIKEQKWTQGLAFPIKQFSTRKTQMSANGILYDSSLVAPSPILCWSWVFFNNTGTALCFDGEHYETQYGDAVD